MDQIELGAGGRLTSRFGIGAMSFAGIYGDATRDQSFAVLDACRDAGVTHIDTANVYGAGRSEEIIGAWFAANPGAREDMVLATKGGITGQPDRPFNNDPGYLMAELDGSLARLGVDHVDLYYMHRYDRSQSPEELGEVLKGLIASGKTRAVGLSEVAPSTLRRVAAICPVAAVQSEYSLSTRAPELGLVQACADVGALLVAFSPVGRTFLTDRPFTLEQVDAIPFLRGNPRFIGPNYSANIKATDGFRALAADMGISAAGLAIAWTRAKAPHVLPIPGTKNTAHLAELLEGCDRVLTAEDLAAIEAVLPVGWAHGDRYNDVQWGGPERYS